MKKIIDFLTPLFQSKFTGRIEINFFQGGIANVNKIESFKL